MMSSRVLFAVLLVATCFSSAEGTTAEEGCTYAGDGDCDSSNNNAECDYDAGDCCECDCSDGEFYDCGEYDCVDPFSTCYGTGNFTEPTSSSTISESSLTRSGSSDESSGGAPVGAIAGGVAGAFLLGAIVVGFMFKTGRLKTRQRGGPSNPNPATVATRRHDGPSDPSAATVTTPANYPAPTATTQYPIVRGSHV